MARCRDAKRGGSQAKGRRLLHDVPSLPDDSGLSPIQLRAQAAVVELVEASGGRFGTGRPVEVGHEHVLSELLDQWGRNNSERRNGRRYFNGHPGLWHALREQRSTAPCLPAVPPPGVP
jgi:hypothetical protein